MSLRSCRRCGGALTDVFRFCPACGDDADDEHGWPVREEDAGWLTDPRWDLETKAPLSFPVVERSRRARREPRRPVAALRARAGTLRLNCPELPRPPVRRLAGGLRRFAVGAGDLAKLLFELVLVSAGSARDGLRATVLLRKLRAQRAAVIYTSGCAALSGDERGVAHARTELQLLDELITAAAARDLPFRGC